MMRKILVFMLLVGCFNLKAQESNVSKNKVNPFYLSVQYIGFTFHPNGGNTPEIYPLKLNKKAYFVFEVGAAINLDYHLSERIFIRSSIAYYRDCAFVPAGYFHLGIRGVIYKKGRHEINGGIGPTLAYREDWHRFPEYKGDAFFGDRVHGKWQYRFILYGGEFEYLYQLNDKIQLQYSLIPGVPFVLTSKIGLKIKI